MENSYFEREGLSFSSLSRLAKHPSLFKTKIKQGRHLDKGSAVDILLTEGLEAFEDQVYLHTDNFPTGKVLTLADTIFKKFQETELDNIFKFATTDMCLETMNEIDFYSNMVDIEAKIKKFNFNDFWNYLKMLSIKDKKIVLDFTEYTTIKRIVESLRYNKFTSPYTQLIPKKDEEIFNQLEVYWEIYNEPIKCKLDRVIINHTNKTIQPIDFKTTGDSTASFKKSILKFKYNYQASIYTEGVNIYFKSLIEKGYKVLPFIFIVETTIPEFIGTPRIFEIDSKTIELSAIGGTINGEYYKGWKEIVKDKIWYDEFGYEEARDYLENNGKIKIELYD